MTTLHNPFQSHLACTDIGSHVNNALGSAVLDQLVIVELHGVTVLVQRWHHALRHGESLKVFNLEIADSDRQSLASSKCILQDARHVSACASLLQPVKHKSTTNTNQET